ncbi:MAG: hypothetical protein WD971_09960, partial [Pirellulales bacterium]
MAPAINVAQDTLNIPEPTGLLAERWSLGKVLGLAALFGPAAILASVSIGAGETIVVVQAGSWAGYDLLWLVLLSVLTKGVCVTYLLGRYTAVSGEAIGQRHRIYGLEVRGGAHRRHARQILSDSRAQFSKGSIGFLAS